MQVDAIFSRNELERRDVSESIVIVMDVLRATTVMITALAHGAKAIIPQDNDSEARKLYAQMTRQNVPVLICGEKDGFKMPGYDLGNSPREFNSNLVQGKTLIHLTTNGTRTLVAAAGAKRILIASFCNRSAIADSLTRMLNKNADRSVLLTASGTLERFSLDDTVCAGSILDALLKLSHQKIDLTDAAQGVLDLYHYHEPHLLDTIRNCFHGRYLEQVGLGDDLPVCAQLDTFSIAPVMQAGQVILPVSDFPD